MEQRTKEEELRIVLKNYDKVRDERDALQKENDALKAELSQQKTLYKNMLDRYQGKGVEDWEYKYKELQRRHDEKMRDHSKILNDNMRMRSMIDAVRGTLRNAHHGVNVLCEKLLIPSEITTMASVPQQEEEPVVVNPMYTMPMSMARFQQQQFIKYIREMAKTLKSTGTLKGIARLAQEYSVTAITKVKFFQYHLDDDNLTDERILAVYEKIKKKGII